MRWERQWSVYQVASVTAARSRAFDTPFGRFTFQRVPGHDPRAGVRVVKLGSDAWAFVATALRAIADTIYLRPAVSWAGDGLGFLTEALRIEYEDLRQIDFACYEEVLESLGSPRVRHYLEGPCFKS